MSLALVQLSYLGVVGRVEAVRDRGRHALTRYIVLGWLELFE